MTDIEMLPMPEGVDVIFSPDGNGAALDVFTAEQVQDYARANVAHATAAQAAEIEALRAEVERLTFEMGCLQQQYDERTAYMIVHRGAGLACSDAVRSAYSDEHHRAERLETALRELLSAADDFMSYSHYEDEIGYRPCCGVLPYKPHEDGCAVTEARAALRDHDQEARNG